jgi:hypothetical protein
LFCCCSTYSYSINTEISIGKRTDSPHLPSLGSEFLNQWSRMDSLGWNLEVYYLGTIATLRRKRGKRSFKRATLIVGWNNLLFTFQDDIIWIDKRIYLSHPRHKLLSVMRNTEMFETKIGCFECQCFGKPPRLTYLHVTYCPHLLALPSPFIHAPAHETHHKIKDLAKSAAMRPDKLIARHRAREICDRPRA